MRKRRQLVSDDEDTGIDITPLVDIVFILLIFFIVTTSFVKTPGVDVNRATADTAEAKERTNIIVAVRPDGAVWIDGRAVPMEAVRAEVERLHARNPKGTVVIDADKQAQTGRTIRVLDQVRAAGVANVALAADRGGG